ARQWNDLQDITSSGEPPQHGVAEVDSIAPGLHFWINVTGFGMGGPGCLFANLVDTNNGNHPIASPPGIVQTNTYQHVALTYDQKTGIAKLYYNGTVVANTNLGIFVPMTTRDVLLGKRYSAFPNEIYQ